MPNDLKWAYSVEKLACGDERWAAPKADERPYIVDGEVELDLPAKATNVVAMLSGQMLQFHMQIRKLTLCFARIQRSDDTRDAWPRSPVSGLLAPQRLPHR